MKLRNKKTGEIGYVEGFFVCEEGKKEPSESYNSLAEISEEWEDTPEGGEE